MGVGVGGGGAGGGFVSLFGVGGGWMGVMSGGEDAGVVREWGCRMLGTCNSGQEASDLFRR